MASGDVESTVTKWARYRLLGLLYTSQLAPLGFFYYALTAVLLRRGVPLQRVGILQLLALFWVVKFAWAPVVDRFGSVRLGHYRGWLLGLQALLVAGTLLLVPLDPASDLNLVFALTIAIAFLSATQDIATDATAVRLLPPSERGAGNGIQLASGNLGFIVGGGGTLMVYDRVGWVAAISVLALIIAAPLPFLARYREPALPAAVGPPAAQRRVSFRTVLEFFQQRHAARWSLVILPLSYAGIAVAAKLVTPILVDRGWALGDIAVVAAFGGGTVAMASALVAGAVLGAVPRRTALLAFGVLALAAVGALGWGWAGAVNWHLLALVAVVNIAYAAMGTAAFTLSMDWSRAASAGTDYTVQSSIAVLSSDVVGAVGLSVAGVLGYRPVLFVALLLCVAGLVAGRWLPRPPVAAAVEGIVGRPAVLR